MVLRAFSASAFRSDLSFFFSDLCLEEPFTPASSIVDLEAFFSALRARRSSLDSDFSLAMMSTVVGFGYVNDCVRGMRGFGLVVWR
jgi:hypothetical protein